MRKLSIISAVLTIAASTVALADTENLKIEVACKRQLLCDEGEVCRARIHYYALELSFADLSLDPAPKHDLAVDVPSGMVSLVSPETNLELFAVDLRQLNCRENDLHFKTYSVALNSLRGWQITTVEQAPKCEKYFNGRVEVRYREGKYALVHESHVGPLFKTPLTRMPCDLQKVGPTFW